MSPCRLFIVRHPVTQHNSFYIISIMLNYIHRLPAKIDQFSSLFHSQHEFLPVDGTFLFTHPFHALCSFYKAHCIFTCQNRCFFNRSCHCLICLLISATDVPKIIGICKCSSKKMNCTTNRRSTRRRRSCRRRHKNPRRHRRSHCCYYCSRRHRRRRCRSCNCRCPTG